MQWRKFADQFRRKLPKLSGLRDQADTDVLSYLPAPAANEAAPTNAIERLNGEL